MELTTKPEESTYAYLFVLKTTLYGHEHSTLTEKSKSVLPRETTHL